MPKRGELAAVRIDKFVRLVPRESSKLRGLRPQRPVVIAETIGAGCVRDDDRCVRRIRPEGVSGKQGELLRDVFGARPRGGHGYPPKGVLKETGASGGEETITENDVEPPGPGVKATSLEAWAYQPSLPAVERVSA